MKAVILAGGHGKRLKPYTLLLPKPMLPLGNKPILSYIIKWLKDQKINDIILSVSYLNKPIEEYFGNGKKFKVKIKYIRSKKPLGTAGQLKKTEALLDDTFICLYADAILDFKLNNVIKFHKNNKSLATIILQEYKTKLKYGFIEINNDKSIKTWKEKPSISGLINTGCYIMDKKFLKFIPKNIKYEMDKSFKKSLQSKMNIYGFKVNGNILDLGDKNAYENAFANFIKKRKND